MKGDARDLRKAYRQTKHILDDLRFLITDIDKRADNELESLKQRIERLEKKYRKTLGIIEEHKNAMEHNYGLTDTVHSRI